MSHDIIPHILLKFSQLHSQGNASHQISEFLFSGFILVLLLPLICCKSPDEAASDKGSKGNPATLGTEIAEENLRMQESEIGKLGMKSENLDNATIKWINASLAE